MKNRKKINELSIYIIPIIITLIILSIIYAVKGFFPFGHNSIAWADMYEQTTLYYYRLYDILNSKASVFYDFSTAMGNNFWGIASFYVFSPFSLLVIFFPRNLIPEFLNILLMVKLSFVCITTVFFFKRIFNTLPKHYVIFFTLCYVFSGYTFIMYQSIQFLDFVILFPLVLLSLKILYDKGLLIPFITILTLCIAINFYIAFMILLFTFFTSIIYLTLYVDKKYIKDRVAKLGFSTATCILLTLPITLPTAIEIFKSNRVPTSLISILSSSYSYTLDKISFFFLSAVVLPFIFILLRKFKENKKFIILSITALLFTTIQVIVDQINLLWQMGSYSAFPLRFGFIPCFILIIMAAYYVNKYDDNSKLTFKSIFILPFMIIFITSTLYVYHNYYEEIQQTISTLTLHSNKKAFLILFILFFIYTFSYFFIIKLSKGKILFATINLLFLIQIILNGLLYIGIDTVTPNVTKEFNDLDILNDYGLSSTNFYRTKDILGTYTSNMAWAINTNSMSQFTSLTNKNHMETMKSLGYSSVWMRVSDIGGTVFTDSIFNIKYLLSPESLNDEYYELIQSVNDINIYQNKYYIPTGIITAKNIANVTLSDNNDVLENNNIIYKSLSQDTECLFTNYTDFTYSNVNVITTNNLSSYKVIDKTQPAFINITLNITDKSQLYLNILKSVSNEYNLDLLNSVKVTVNNKPLSSYLYNDLYNSDTDTYPSTFNNGLLNLGMFENESVNITLQVLNDFQASQIAIGSMDVEKFISFASSRSVDYANIQTAKNYLTGEVVADNSDSLLFLSLPYDDGWTCTVNGEPQDIYTIYGDFIGIPLNEGVNTILLRYYPEGFKVAAILCILTMIYLLLTYVDYVKLGKFLSYKIINSLYTLYCFLYVIGLILVYIMPILVFIFFTIKRFTQ